MKLYYYCGAWNSFHKDVQLRNKKCAATGETAVNDLDWLDGVVKITCPVCRSSLRQEDNHFSIKPFTEEE